MRQLRLAIRHSPMCVRLQQHSDSIKNLYPEIRITAPCLQTVNRSQARRVSLGSQSLLIKNAAQADNKSSLNAKDL